MNIYEALRKVAAEVAVDPDRFAAQYKRKWVRKPQKPDEQKKKETTKRANLRLLRSLLK